MCVFALICRLEPARPHSHTHARAHTLHTDRRGAYRTCLGRHHRQRAAPAQGVGRRHWSVASSFLVVVLSMINAPCFVFLCFCVGVRTRPSAIRVSLLLLLGFHSHTHSFCPSPLLAGCGLFNIEKIGDEYYTYLVRCSTCVCALCQLPCAMPFIVSTTVLIVACGAG